jgi:hypothetical protein
MMVGLHRLNAGDSFTLFWGSIEVVGEEKEFYS